MTKLHTLMLTGALLALSPLASAETVNLTNSAEGANRDAGITAVRKKLQDACTERKGTPDAASFEVVFEDQPKPERTQALLRGRQDEVRPAGLRRFNHLCLKCAAGTAPSTPATAQYRQTGRSAG